MSKGGSSLILASFIVFLAIVVSGCLSEQESHQRELRGKGMALYGGYCAECHGLNGEGSSAMPKAPVLNAPQGLSKYDDAELYKIIVEGHQKVPKAKFEMDTTKGRQIIAYLRFLSSR